MRMRIQTGAVALVVILESSRVECFSIPGGALSKAASVVSTNERAILLKSMHDENVVAAEMDSIISNPTGDPSSLSSSSSSMLVVTPQHSSQEQQQQQQRRSLPLLDSALNSYWGPRALLAIIPAVYGTNFALGSLMESALPASTVTALRMSLAAAALFPWLLQIDRKLVPPAILAGCCTAIGYVSQSLALVDTDPARVSFLGAAMVVWCPVLEACVDGRDVRWKTAPQIWISAALCLVGVGVLEGVFLDSSTAMTGGDGLALLQAIGFGTQCFICGKLVQASSSQQILPITAVLVTTTAVVAWMWCGLLLDSSTNSVWHLVVDNDPAILLPVLGAVVWTGLVSTSGAFAVEVAALGRVPSSEASVLLATEPIWAAVFASAWLGNTLDTADYIGGALMISACLVNALRPDDLRKLFLPSASE